MNKKLIIGLSMLFILCLTHNADARLLFEPFEAIYMTDSYGSTAEKTIFDWDEIP